MKKMLLLALLTAIAPYAKAQSLKPFKPSNDNWYDTATSQQLKDSADLHHLQYEQAQRKVNLLKAMSEIREDLAYDSVARVRATQMKEWSKVPAARTRKTVKKSINKSTPPRH